MRKLICLSWFLVGVVALSLSFSGAAFSAEDEFGWEDDGPTLEESLKERREDKIQGFFAIATGSILGAFIFILTSVVWRTSPRVAQFLAAILVIFTTSVWLGSYLLAGSLTSRAVSSLSASIFASVALLWSFRSLRLGEAKKRLPMMLSSGGKSKTKRGAEKTPASKEQREASILITQAFTHLDDGDVDTAIAQLKASIAIEPKARAHTYLATIYGARGHIDEAIKELTTALSLNPTFKDAILEMRTLLKNDNRSEELEIFEKRLASAKKEKSKKTKTCPLCETVVEEAQAKCTGCDVDLSHCAKCGQETKQMSEYEGQLVCPQCRRNFAHAHAKTKAASASREVTGETSPTKMLTFLAVSLTLGIMFSLLYSTVRERNAMATLREIIISATEGNAVAWINGDRNYKLQTSELLKNDTYINELPATLKLRLAIYGRHRAAELTKTESELGDVALRWSIRRLIEAEAALNSDTINMSVSEVEKSFKNATRALEDDISRRREIATVIPVVPPEPVVVEKTFDIKTLTRSPEVGEVFYLERFGTLKPKDAKKVTLELRHMDGRLLAAEALLRVEVVDAKNSSINEGLSFLVESIGFEVKSNADIKMGPKVRLVARESVRAKMPGRWRIDFDSKMRFVALHNLGEKDAGKVISWKDLFAKKELPMRELPLFFVGLDENLIHEETRLHLYPNEQPHRGPVIRQRSRVKRDADGEALGLSLIWEMNYSPLSRRSSNMIVQHWYVGSIWWNIYDDGTKFFRFITD